jgi:hypothetical protein
MGPFVTRALAAVLDSSSMGAEVILDLSPAQGASPGSIDVLRGAMQRATDRGVAVTVHVGPDALQPATPAVSTAGTVDATSHRTGVRTGVRGIRRS